MTRGRLTTGIAICFVCGLGAIALSLLGTPWGVAVTIGVAAAAATVFSRWARTLHTRRSRPDRSDQSPD